MEGHAARSLKAPQMEKTMADGPLIITGATGFVGRRLVADLAASGRREVIALVRGPAQGFPPGIATDSLDAFLDRKLDPALRGARLIHLLGRAHVMRETAADSLAAFRAVNRDLTLSVARRFAQAGGRRFVFVSSIKVNGEETAPGKPFAEAEVPAPADPYGLSKWEAERALWQLSAETGLQVCVVRPALVLGPGARGNVASMLRWIERGVPLPFGAIDNRRSFVGIDNLASLLLAAADHPRAAGETFLAADGEDLSTPALLTRIGRLLGRPPRLIPVPPALIRRLAGLLGQKAKADRLLGSLQVDGSRARTCLGWTPPKTLDQSLADMIER